MAASKPAFAFPAKKLGILNTLPIPLKPAAAALACFMTSGLFLTLEPTASAPRAAIAHAATPHPRMKGVAMPAERSPEKVPTTTASEPAWPGTTSTRMQPKLSAQ